MFLVLESNVRRVKIIKRKFIFIYILVKEINFMNFRIKYKNV